MEVIQKEMFYVQLNNVVVLYWVELKKVEISRFGFEYIIKLVEVKMEGQNFID